MWAYLNNLAVLIGIDLLGIDLTTLDRKSVV